MRPSEALVKHRDEVLAILARYPVSNPRVFGSVARGEDTEGSDLDLMVEPVTGVTTLVDLGLLREELVRVLGKEVDLTTDGSFNPRSARRIQRDLIAL